MTRSLAILVVMLTAANVLAEPPVDYDRQIKPLLREKCYACHGALKQEGGLRLDAASLIQQGGDSGSILSRSSPEESAIIQRVRAVDGERMPPESEGSALMEVDIQLLTRWIKEGARAPDEPIPVPTHEHWAFQPIVRPNVPVIDEPTWNGNEVDAFIHRKRVAKKLSTPHEARRLILLRRLYIDLIGVPPTLKEIEQCLQDESADWYAKTARRLLADSRHGERWGRHWMDIWRYSDWWGFGAQLRYSQRHMWHWRDWIVTSLNDDAPYDEMVRLMLAADELHPNDMDKLRASGFLARNYFLFNRTQWMDETVEHVSKGFLGLTVNCAKCHDHKYDPLQQIDFYRMRAFFEPYHVRLDMMPGQPDLNVDGMPRVFDGLLDQPTYLFVRGDEKHADKSRSITPDVPDFLRFAPLEIRPVSLPSEAWQPGLRPWVADALLSQSNRQLVEAKAALEKSETHLSNLKSAGDAVYVPTPDANKLLIRETFEAIDENRWELFGGDWKCEKGRLIQARDGKTRAVLRLREVPPNDLDATVRFSIDGGSLYRSVGLSFDAAPQDPTDDRSATYYEQNVYVSGQEGANKIHAAFNQNGQWTYPPSPSVRKIAVELNRVHTLRVQILGRQINAYLDGQLVLACTTPQTRRRGKLQLTTFDALATFHEFALSPLGSDAKLRAAGVVPLSPQELTDSIPEAKAQVAADRANVHRLEAEIEDIRKRQDAFRAKDEKRKSAIVEAVLAGRALKVAEAEHAVAISRRDLVRTNDDKKNEVESALKASLDRLQMAREQSSADVPDDADLPLFVGAKWTPTRFANTSKDDPEIHFPPTSTGRRTALARWITDRRNPLTARVAVNHIWTRHMGQPLVSSVFNFGRNGSTPTHPDLLDWLAVELIENEWRMKHIHSLIVNSNAYKMASGTNHAASDLTGGDPDNYYWTRRPTIRLESQVIRDSILALGGRLDDRMGGPPVPRGEQETSRRRSLYFFHSSNDRNRFLATFDEAMVRDCYRREQSIVPQQALAMANSALVWDSAEAIRQSIAPHSVDDEEFIKNAFLLILAAEPTRAEAQSAREALKEWRSIPGIASSRAHTKT